MVLEQVGDQRRRSPTQLFLAFFLAEPNLILCSPTFPTASMHVGDAGLFPRPRRSIWTPHSISLATVWFGVSTRTHFRLTKYKKSAWGLL